MSHIFYAKVIYIKTRDHQFPEFSIKLLLLPTIWTYRAIIAVIFLSDGDYTDLS